MSSRKFLGRAASFVRAVIPEAVRSSRLIQFARHAIIPHDRIYDHDYYTTDVEKAALESATIMANSLAAHFKPKSVIDVGCGTGALLVAFRNCGCEVKGLEYSRAGIAFCEKRGLSVRKFNIVRDRFTERSHFDMATSFEVAEHIPARYANRYVDLLCQLSSVLVMTAATPGQGGTDHVNEQPHSYWIKKFADRGYSWEQSVANQIAEFWQKSGVAAFYFANVMIFRRLN